METQPRSLNTLYKLLWEQIKQPNPTTITVRYEIRLMMNSNKISIYEMIELDRHFFENKKDYEQSILFVQRMIKETEKLK